MCTSTEMNHSAPGVVVKPPDLEPAVVVPAPVRGHGVHDARDDGGVDDVRGEVAALGERPGDQGGGGGGKHELEQPLREREREDVSSCNGACVFGPFSKRLVCSEY